MVFECPIEDCQFESCRKCGKVSHIPLRCDEVTKEKRQDEGRLKVEEAISEAKIRKCPKCKTPFVKTEGCNKMTCRCGVKICYICRKQVADYSHFCQKPHCDHKKCKLCTLYSNAEEDDARAMREAGVGAAEAYRSELLQKDQDADIQIDVDNILQNSPPTVRLKQKRRIGR
jgi:TRIAD3 protein (E3 ubiquitin-protein ligase RNF216)